MCVPLPLQHLPHPGPPYSAPSTAHHLSVIFLNLHRENKTPERKNKLCGFHVYRQVLICEERMHCENAVSTLCMPFPSPVEGVHSGIPSYLLPQQLPECVCIKIELNVSRSAELVAGARSQPYECI